MPDSSDNAAPNAALTGEPSEPRSTRVRRPTEPTAGPAAAKPSRPRKRRSTPVSPELAAVQPAKSVNPANPPRRSTARRSRAGRGRGAAAKSKETSLRVLMVASEALPYSKSGGLADVAAALPLELGRLGHEVVLVTPRYRGVAVSGPPAFSCPVAAEGLVERTDIFLESLGPGVRVALVDCPRFYDREGLYGHGGRDYADNPLRFAVLCRAAFATAEQLGAPIDIVHAHDWQAGLAPYLLESDRGHGCLAVAASVFTIHNLAYQGACDKDWVPRLGLRWRDFHANGFEHWNQLSLLKAGINFSRVVTTVSPSYAREILTAEQGFGFEGVLQRRQHELVGILNGIDIEQWDPARDPYLRARYDSHDLAGKDVARHQLLEAYQLPRDDGGRVPVVGMIARMVDQKGLDLIAQIADDLPHLGARFVVLGTGDAGYQDMWRTLAQRYPDRVGARIGFDESLAHLIEAGADLFLMPSRFEPCGLNQMYSLRYGTLPLVRATGGLDDTVENFDPSSGGGTGFKFWDYTPQALLGTLRWAMHVFATNPEAWRQMQVRGMQADFSWAASARNYVKVYEAAGRAA